MNFEKINNIPHELKALNIWCVQKNKIPCNPCTHNPAKSNDINSFSDYESAFKAYKDFTFDGLGIGLFGNIGVIDIDHCVSNGQMSDMAKNIVNTMNSYTEYSPSGTGVHIIFYINNFNYDKDRFYIHNKNLQLEIYVAGTTNKYVTITGNVINDNQIKTCDTELQNILNKYMRRENEMKNYNIDDLIKIGLEKDSKLNDYWNGIRPYESESENDAGFMAKLLYWTNRDIETAIKYFKQSPYTSQKDEKHKKKLERVDYLTRTANAVMPSTTALENNEKWKLSNKVNKITTKTNFNIISAQDLQNADLPPIEYIVDDILPVGTTLICAAPKIGKSWFVLNLGLNISIGYRFMHKPTKQIGVLYLALEDSYTRLQSRLAKYTSNAPDNFYFSVKAPKIDEGLFDLLDEQLKKHPDIKLLIIDTLEKIRGKALSYESLYKQDYRELGLLKQYADSKNISLLLVHHTRKAKDTEDPYNMISGSNGIMGAVDTAFMITKDKRIDNKAVLYITGRDVDEISIAMHFNKTVCHWEFDGSLEKVQAEEKRLEYLNNPIVKTIKHILETDKQWKGNASNLLKTGEDLIGIPIAVSAQALSKSIEEIKNDLNKYDNITYLTTPNGTAGKIHHFMKK